LSVLPDWGIRRLNAIKPYTRGVRIPGVISYGESSCGYDLRLGRKFLIFSNTCACVVDPKNFDGSQFVAHEGLDCLIPPNSFVLAESQEWVEVPRDCICLVLGKSTYARCGICTNFTPLEPGWRGRVTIEIGNMTPLPAKIYADEGIAQVLFLTLAGRPEKDYSEKDGLYQDQQGLTLPKVSS
jgi:dCTP deaminase